MDNLVGGLHLIFDDYCSIQYLLCYIYCDHITNDTIHHIYISLFEPTPLENEMLTTNRLKIKYTKKK